MTVVADAGMRTGTVRSGDIDLFYRVFGKPGATPIVIFHGANYYDSADGTRLVVTFPAEFYTMEVHARVVASWLGAPL